MSKRSPCNGTSQISQTSQAPLSLTSVKSRVGYATECAGIVALHRLMLSALWGFMTPNNHLQQLNPHLEFENKANLLTAPWPVEEPAEAALFPGSVVQHVLQLCVCVQWARRVHKPVRSVRSRRRRRCAAATWVCRPMASAGHKSTSYPMATLSRSGHVL